MFESEFEKVRTSYIQQCIVQNVLNWISFNNVWKCMHESFKKVCKGVKNEVKISMCGIVRNLSVKIDKALV